MFRPARREEASSTELEPCAGGVSLFRISR